MKAKKAVVFLGIFGENLTFHLICVKLDKWLLNNFFRYIFEKIWPIIGVNSSMRGQLEC